MWTKPFGLSIAIAIFATAAPRVGAQTIACDCQEFGVTSEIVFETTRTNVLTVDPAGHGETLESAGITLRLRILCNYGYTDPAYFRPAAGIPFQEIQLYTPELATCIPLMASTPTDSEGWTEFHGTFQAGGCAEHVRVYVDGYFIAELPLRFNSPDTGTASPGRVDASDLEALARHLGRPDLYSMCFDFNEDGSTDACDLAYFAVALGTGCQ